MNSKVDSNISGTDILYQALLGFSLPLPFSERGQTKRTAKPGLLKRTDFLPEPEGDHRDQAGVKKKPKKAVVENIREVTAYNVGDPKQNFGNPCISANGENICAALARGLKRCAANFVPFGTKLHIEGVGYCTVTDRMNRRYKNRVDIAMKLTEKARALKFGLQKLRVRIIKSN